MANTPRRFSVVASVVCFLFVAGNTPAEEKPTAPLHLVPGDAAGFVHIRPADLWTKEAFADLRHLLAKAGPKAWQWFENKYVPAPSTVDRVTLIYLNWQSLDTPMFSGDPDAVSPLVVVTTSKPFDRNSLQKALGPDARLKKHKGQSYYGVESTWTAFQFLDDRTFILGSEEALLQWLNRSGKNPGPLQAALRAASGNHQVVVGLNPAAWPKEPFGPFRPVNKTFTSVSKTIGVAPPAKDAAPPPKAPANPPAQKPGLWSTFMQPLLKARCVTFTFNLDQKLHAKVKLDFAGEDQAAGGVKSVRAGLDAFGESLVGSIDELERELREGKRFFGTFTNKKPQQPAAFPKDLDQATADLAILLQLGWHRSLQEQVKTLAVEQQGKSVKLEASIPMNVSTWIFAVMALGTNANKTFTSVSNTIGTLDIPESREDLKKLARALDEYHQKHGRFPAAARYDRQGQPLLSWRVELLSFLGENELYRRFKLDEPWDSAHNKKLLKKMPKVFQGWSRESWKTPFQVFAGPGTAFEGKQGLRRADIKDDPAQTILVVKTAEEFAVAWTKPADLPYAADQPLPQFQSTYDAGFLAVFADASVRAIDRDIDAKTLRALITRNGGERLQEDSPGRFKLGAGLAPVLPRGMRAVAVRVKKDNIAAAFASLPNSRVDLIATVRREERGGFSRVLLENVLVLAADSEIREETIVVTLALIPEDAAKVALAQTVGSLSLSLALRPPRDESGKVNGRDKEKK